MTSSRARPAAGLLWLALAPQAAAGGLHLFEAVEPHMGTLVRISVYTQTPERAKAAFRAAFERVAQVDGELSDYQPESELNRLCRAAPGTPVPVSEDLFRVLAAAQQLAVESNGAFDVTLGPVIRLWRESRRKQTLPSTTLLREAASRSGYRKLHLDAEARSVTLDRAGMQLDLGGIGKGYAADAAVEVLAAMGIRRALVAASGDLAFGDPPPGQRGWRIGIEGSARVLEMSNAAVSTSGDSAQHADIAGKRYSHIVDPATGIGTTTPVAITVVARRGMEADSLATAVAVLGSQAGAALIAGRPGVELIVNPRRP